MEPEQAGTGPVTQDRRVQADGLRDARSHLRQADPVLARLVDERPDFSAPGETGDAAQAAPGVMDRPGARARLA